MMQARKINTPNTITILVKQMESGLGASIPRTSFPKRVFQICNSKNKSSAANFSPHCFAFFLCFGFGPLEPSFITEINTPIAADRNFIHTLYAITWGKIDFVQHLHNFYVFEKATGRLHLASYNHFPKNL